MTIEYFPKLKNQFEAYDHFLKTRKSYRIIKKALGFILLFVGLLEIVISVLGKMGFAYIILGTLFSIFGFFEGTGILSIGKLRVLIYFKSEMLAQKKQCIQISNECINYKIDNAESRIEWSFYKQYIESPNTFILIASKYHYTVLPKEAFMGDEINNLRELLVKKFKD
jgi:hypothetical protein